jgi:hypothetical protein
MGRIKKYLTKEEKFQAQKEWSKKYYWKNKEQEDEKARQRYQNNKNNKLNKPNYKSRKPILQYDLEGNFIKEWDSATTIKKELNINNVSIMQCCKKIIKSSHNYVWKYKK